jgi:hypothetical protein
VGMCCWAAVWRCARPVCFKSVPYISDLLCKVWAGGARALAASRRKTRKHPANFPKFTPKPLTSARRMWYNDDDYNKPVSPHPTRGGRAEEDEDEDEILHSDGR